MTHPNRPKSLVIILARDLASRLATPAFLVDDEGTLVYFNEAAEAVLGRPFAEVGEVTVRRWANIFVSLDDQGEPLAWDALPIGVALIKRRPSHRRLQIRTEDGEVRPVSATATPLFSQEDHVEGALALFWEEPETP
jgi:PAS domain-containing protein